MRHYSRTNIFPALVGSLFIILTSSERLVFPVVAVASGAETIDSSRTTSSGTSSRLYIVVLKKGVADGADISDRAGKLVHRYGGTLIDVYGKALPGFAAELTEDQAAKIAADPSVKYVEQNQGVRGN
jgi:hypothetical protein